MLEQLCHVKNAWYDVLKFMITKICCITSEEKTRVFKVWDFSGKPNFWEDVVFHHKIFSLSILGLDLIICSVNTIILVQKSHNLF